MSSSEEDGSSFTTQVFEFGSAFGMSFDNISSVVEDINRVGVGNDDESGESSGNGNDGGSEGIGFVDFMLW